MRFLLPREYSMRISVPEKEQKCASHTLATKYFSSTAFVPRAKLRIVCPKGFYVIGELSYYIKNRG